MATKMKFVCFYDTDNNKKQLIPIKRIRIMFEDEDDETKTTIDVKDIHKYINVNNDLISIIEKMEECKTLICDIDKQ